MGSQDPELQLQLQKYMQQVNQALGQMQQLEGEEKQMRERHLQDQHDIAERRQILLQLLAPAGGPEPLRLMQLAAAGTLQVTKSASNLLLCCLLSSFA